MGSILWVMLKRRAEFFESYLIKETFNSVNKWIIFKKGFNYLTHFPKVNSLCQIKKRFNSSSQFFEKNFNLKSHWKSSIKKCSILWVIFWKRFNFWVIFWNCFQFFESYWKEGLYSLNQIFSKKKVQCLVICCEKNSLNHIQKKKFSSLNHIQQKKFLWVISKKVQFIESF